MTVHCMELIQMFAWLIWVTCYGKEEGKSIGQKWGRAFQSQSSVNCERPADKRICSVAWQQHQSQECQEGCVWLIIIMPGCWHTDSPCPSPGVFFSSECECLHPHKGDPLTRIESNNSRHVLPYCWHSSPWWICEEMSGDTMCYKITAWWIQMRVQHQVPWLIWCRLPG